MPRFYPPAAPTKAAAPAEALLFLQVPQGSGPAVQCAGVYALDGSRRVRGAPVYHQAGGARTMYTDSTGRWTVWETAQAEQADYACATGFLSTAEPHRGLTPPCSRRAVWRRFDPLLAAWVADTQVACAAGAPRWPAAVHFVVASARDATRRCGGAFRSVAGRWMHGAPVYEQVGSQGRLLLSTDADGRWVVTRAGPDGCCTDVAPAPLIAARRPHGARPPTATPPDGWQWHDGHQWRDGGGISCCTGMPPWPAELTLRLGHCPRRQDSTVVEDIRADMECTGVFRVDPEVAANGAPVYRQAGGDKLLYSGITGKWLVWDSEAEECGFACGMGWVAAAAPHGGLPPYCQRWERRGPQGWEEDGSAVWSEGGPVCVPALSLSLPDGNSVALCGGLYVIDRGKLANGWPPYHQPWAGGMWLYTGSDGRWYVGDEDELNQGFQCTGGWIASASPHGGKGPHEVGEWLTRRRSDGDWRPDHLLTVFAVPGGALPAELRAAAGVGADGEPASPPRKRRREEQAPPAGCAGSNAAPPAARGTAPTASAPGGEQVEELLARACDVETVDRMGDLEQLALALRLSLVIR